MTADIREIVKFVKSHRTARGWTQKYLAKKAGTTQQHVSRLENGYRHPSLRLLAKIADIFGYRFSVKFEDKK